MVHPRNQEPGTGEVSEKMATKYETVDELEQALRRAAAAHGVHEAETGEEDAEWPVWYAQFMADEQAADA